MIDQPWPRQPTGIADAAPVKKSIFEGSSSLADGRTYCVLVHSALCRRPTGVHDRKKILCKIITWHQLCFPMAPLRTFAPAFRRCYSTKGGAGRTM